jgi:hypothetical protein
MSVDQRLKSFVWSSWPGYLLAPSKRPAWLRVDRLLGEWGIPKDSPAGRQQMERALEARRGAVGLGWFVLGLKTGWSLESESASVETTG